MNTEDIINAYAEWRRNTKARSTRDRNDQRFGQWFVNKFYAGTCPSVFYEESPEKAFIKIVESPLFNSDVMNGHHH